MKATGEVMAIGWNFEAALVKAVRSLELNLDSLESPFVKNNGPEQPGASGNRTTSGCSSAAQALRTGVSMEETMPSQRSIISS